MTLPPLDPGRLEPNQVEAVERLERSLRESKPRSLVQMATGSGKIIFAVTSVYRLIKANVLFFDRKPGAGDAWTKAAWVYDLRTNKHFTLKTRRLARTDLDDFVACYNPGDRHRRKATWSEQSPEGRWRAYS
jgi:hypothetical protein